MAMSGFEFALPQPGSEDFDMDNFTSFDFDTGQFLNSDLQSSYASGPEHPESIRPSDLVTRAFHDNRAFGAPYYTESTPQIDPSLTESQGVSAQPSLARPWTPPTSLSPEHLDAVSSRPGSMTGTTVTTGPAKSNKQKRKAAEIEDGDVDAERRFKNRVAASKCRVKKKGREQMLIQEKDQQEHDNMKLKEEYRHLTQEALWYKNQIIMHGNCGDSRINQWLSNSAAKIVHTFGEPSTFPLDTPARPVAQPPAKHEYERRDSGISTNSKAGHGVSPLSGRPLSVQISLGSPVERASPANLRDSPVQSEDDRDVDVEGGQLLKRARSLSNSTLNSLANAAASRAKSVPLQQPDVPKHTNSGHDDDSHQGLPMKESMAPVSASVPTAPCGISDSKPTGYGDAQFSPSAVTIDPRLRGGEIPLGSLNSDAEYFDIPIRPDEHDSDALQQIPGTKWMEA